MFTQCPQCQTVFRVTATMLKAAQGRVRCGRCAHVFNALTFLIEPDEAAAAAQASAPSSPAAPQNTAAPPVVEPEADAANGVAPIPEEITLSAEHEIELDAADIPESALEFTADDLSKVFVVEAAPTLPHPATVTVSEDDTAEHEILDIELATGTDAEARLDEDISVDEGAGAGAGEEIVADEATHEPGIASETITLEGDSVVLEEEDPSVSGAFFAEDPAAASATPAGSATPATSTTSAPSRPTSPSDRRSGGDRRRAAEDNADLAFGSLTKQKSPTTEAIDEEVQREIEAAFAADPTTRAEFILPSGRRLAIGGETATDADTDAALAAHDPHEALLAQQRQHRRVMLGWTIASGVLALTLVMQLVHHNRQSLVRNATIGPMLEGLYGAFGSDLVPVWNVRAYELRQFGAAADADAQGTLRVRASLLNGAVHAQPYPVLRLTLQDRFGGQVGLRDLQPREYLRSAPSRNALIGAGQRIDADIAIVDPGQDAVGFEIDVCLPVAAQGLTCANDAARNAG